MPHSSTPVAPLAEDQLIRKAAELWRRMLLGNEEEAFKKGLKVRRIQREQEEAGLSSLENASPADIMGPSPGVMVSGITKYINSAGKPDRLARMIASETFKNKMEQLGLKAVGEKFASRYPRIAAHINPGKLVDPIASGRADIGTELGRYNPTVRVGLDVANPNVDRTLAHEATHVAQRLGLGKKMANAYGAAESKFGYNLNPFEQSANNAALRYSTGNRAIPPKTLTNISEFGYRNDEPFLEPVWSRIRSWMGR
jgi:hypothetical protein